jgi:choline kinase
MDTTQSKIRTAVILAAGRGARLRRLTDQRPKCLLEIAGTSILERMLDQLQASGIENVILVVGYRAERIEEKIGPERGGMAITYVRNEHWENSNNVLSLQLAGRHLKTSFLLLESDLVFDQGALRQFGPHNAMAVDHYQDYMDGTVVKISGQGAVEAMYLKSTPNRPADLSALYKTVNIYSFDLADFTNILYPILGEILDQGLLDAYYELAFARAIARQLIDFKIVDFHPFKWVEIDDQDDLKRAERLFSCAALIHDAGYETPR